MERIIAAVFIVILFFFRGRLRSKLSSRKLATSLIIVLWLTVLPVAAYTSLADSLQARLRIEKSDTGRVMTYNRLARNIANTANLTPVTDRVAHYHTALQYADSGLLLSQSITFRKGEAELYRTIGAVNYFLADYDKAIYNYNQALAIATDINDDYGTGALEYNIAMIYDKQGQNIKALRYYFASASVWEKLEKKPQLLVANAGISKIYHDVNEFDLSIEYTRKSILLAFEMKDTLRVATLFGTMAGSYLSKGDTLSAVSAYEKSIELYHLKGNASSEARATFNYASNIKSIPLDRRKIMLAKTQRYFEKNDPEHQNLAIIYHRLGDICQASGQADSARYYYSKAIKQALLSNHAPTISLVYKAFAYQALAVKNIDQAEKYFHATLDYNKQVGDWSLEQYVYNGLAEVYRLKGDDKQAFQIKQRAIRLQDSIAVEESKKRIEVLQMQHELKEQQELQETEWKAQVNRQQRIFERRQRSIIVIMVALVLLSASAGHIIRNRRRTKRNNIRLQEQHEEILQIQEELRQSNDELNMYKEYLEDTVRKKTAEQADKDQQLRHISDNVPGFIFRRITKADGQSYISYISNTVEQLVGVSADTVLKEGRLMSRIVDQTFIAEIQEKEKESILTMTPLSFEYCFIKDGQPVWLYNHALPHLGENGNLMWDGFVIDITVQKDVEISLEKAKEKAEESDKLKSAFLSNMSHEIRTPMNAILGFMSFLEKANLPAEKRGEYIRIVQESINQLLSLIKNIIDISKLDVKQGMVYPARFALNALMEEIGQHWGTNVNQKKPLDVILDNSQFIYPDCVCNDQERLKQVLFNLIDNAIKYTEKGFVRFGYEPADDPSELLFFVEDTGIGVPENQREFIFEYFRQGANTELQPIYGGGTGLGLSISKGLVEQMGGRIWVQSAEGRGSTFFFTIKRELEQTQIE